MSNVKNFFEQAKGSDTPTDNPLNLTGTVKGKAGSQNSAISDATGGATVDVEARAAINAALAVLRDLGLIQT